MNDYNDYVSAVNKIFDYLNKMRTGWNSQDNISHIENIEEYKRVVVANVETFKKPAPMPTTTEPTEEQKPEEVASIEEDTLAETPAEM